jgi:class 3 adenylate cyclase
MAIVQLRHPTAGQTYYRGKRAEGKSQEALRGLKRRLSAAAYRCLIADEHRRSRQPPGWHTGEVELRDGDVGGIGVHIAARIVAAAESGEILTSRTVRDLVVGSDIAVEDRGTHALKGIDGTWQLFAITRP